MRAGTLMAVAMMASGTLGCADDSDDGGDGGGTETSRVGLFTGLFDEVAVGFNYAYDIAVVPHAAGTDEAAGDIFVANYGTSEILRVPDPTGQDTPVAVQSFFDGSQADLAGAMGVSATADGTIWAAFERGGDEDAGGIAILDLQGGLLNVLDAAVIPGALSQPGGICLRPSPQPGPAGMFFLVNKGDGSAWRITVADAAGNDPAVTRLGSGLATGDLGEPGTAPDGVSNKKDLPEGGARGCVYIDGRLYVADGQNARVVRFADAEEAEDAEGVALEDTPAELVTYPTAVSTNHDGDLIVLSADNAHAFVALETPSGRFKDNGLHDLNVNSGNHGAQVADGTIWFTRANNSNGSLRAVTPDMATPPSTDGDFPPQ